MKRKVTIGVVTLMLVGAVILAASAFGLVGAAAQGSGCCATQQGTMGQSCPMISATGDGAQMLNPASDGLKKALNLTPEQDQKISAAIKSFMADEATVMGDLKAKRTELLKMIISGSPTKAQIASKVDGITALHSKLMLDAADRFADAKSILTPAQLKTLAEKADQLGPMCMGMGGSCGMMGSGPTMGGAPPMVPGHQMTGQPGKATEQKVESAICPVMKNRIPDITKAAGHSVYKGKTYYFCCASCKPLFDKDPGKYVK